MIVFDLFCSAGHRFEAWFRNGAAFDEQRAAASIRCPTCGDSEVVKAPTRLYVAGSRSRSDDGPGEDAPAEPPAASPTLPPPVPAELADVLQRMREHVETSCDYVGDRFAEEARSIHYGETDARDIYGEASAEDARALREEGITVQPLPWPARRSN